jgi:nitrite reductase/ring-hydroxylating ferredoxin subunit
MDLLGCGDCTDAGVVVAAVEQRVGDASALKEGGRLHAKAQVSHSKCNWGAIGVALLVHECTGNAACAQGRYVTVLRLDGQLSCIDSVCFHAGGPLVSMRANAALCRCSSSHLPAEAVTQHAP